MDENNCFNLENSDSGDDFVIGKGFSVSEYDPNADKRKKSRRKKGSVIKSIIWIMAIVIVSLGIAFGVIYAGADYLGIGFGRGENCVVEIPMGSSTTAIAEALSEEDVNAVKWPLLFRLYSKLKGYDSQYKYGVYSFNNEAGYEELANMLMTDGAKAESVSVTIPEGTGINDFVKNVNGEDVTVVGIASLLEKAGVCERADFIAAFNKIKLESRLLKNVNVGKTYHALEGYLFPDTYDFYAYDSEECAVLAAEKMVAELEKRITDKMFERANELGYSMNDILTLASIVQMEAGNNTDEMPHVASVFYNRLESDDYPSLGSSPTIYYGRSFSQDDGRYNTQGDDEFPAIKGLPPGPLCSPGMDAINSVLYPTENVPYYYFVTDSDGHFYYTKTLSEHQNTINRLQRGDKWIYEYFD